MATLYGLIPGGTFILAFLKVVMSSDTILAIMLCFCFITLVNNVLPRLGLSNGLPSDHIPSNDNEGASQPKTLKPIKLKLLIDKNRHQVVFAECDKDFVDVLLSFLTLPVGRIISLSNKESGIGSMDALYKSVEALNTNCFKTKACKNMLLDPRSAYGLQCKNLALKMDETDYTRLYTCSKTPCLNSESFGFVSLVENSICACGRKMNNKLRMKYSDWKSDCFVNRVDRFIVSDELVVLPATISNTRGLLLRQGIRDNAGVQEWNIHIGLEEVLKLLNQSLLSKTPLTDVFLPNSINIINTVEPSDLVQELSQSHSDNHSGNENLTVKLWFSKSTNRVICAEAKDDFIDFLFSFLTLPLGSIIKLLEGKSSLGSIDKLYKSAEKLCSRDIVYARSKGMLLSPKLERMFGCENQLLVVEEEVTPSEFVYNKCYSCCIEKKPCSHTQFQRLKIMNPKIPGVTKPGGGFMRENGCLLVTDNLVVEGLSPVSGMNRLDVPFSDLEHIRVRVGKKEALYLLKAALTSKTVLTQAFSAQVISSRNRRLYHYYD